jgi:hypothetical protein
VPEGLTCLHGTRWIDHFSGPLFACPACADSVAAGIAWCAREIAEGRMDADLYTPAERRQKAKRDESPTLSADLRAAE